MPGPYFQKATWRSFTWEDQIYPLEHLDEYTVSALDAEKREHSIAVTFSDHCFTRDAYAQDDMKLRYAGSSRTSGCFDFERYALSLGIRSIISQGIQGNVWLTDGDNVAFVPTVDHKGTATFYGIFFSIIPVKGLPVRFRMLIRSAYPCTEKSEVATFGSVQFSRLLSLSLQRKKPQKQFGPHRKRPKL